VTPTTGADLPVVISRALVLCGMALMLAGLWLWRRQRHFGHS
jgi:succinate-acetate transporter protein